MPGTTPTALDLAEVLFRRTLRHVTALRGAVPRPWHDAVRGIARAAARHRAKSLDAVPFEGTLTIALGVGDGALPELPQRQRELVRRVSGLSVSFVSAEWVPQPSLDGKKRARRQLGRAGRWYLARIASLEPDAALDRDPEAVHQIRVALRRLRCVLRVVARGGVPPWFLDALAFVRTLGERAGRVRDLDVSLELLTRLDLDPARRAEMAARLRGARAPAWESLREALDGGLLTASRRALDEGISGLERPRGSLRDVGRTHFERELMGLQRSFGGDLQHAEGFHEIRKRARRVRDAIDVLGGSLRDRERAWRKRLHPLQSHLGSLNDAAVMTVAVAGDDELARAVREVLERRRLTLLAELATPLALLAGTLDRR